MIGEWMMSLPVEDEMVAELTMYRSGRCRNCDREQQGNANK